MLTVGTLRAGTKANVIPDDAELLVNIRSYEPVSARTAHRGDHADRPRGRRHGRRAEAPEVTLLESAPTLTNDVAATERTLPALGPSSEPSRVIDPGNLPSSEDVSILATAAGAPLVFWLLGGAEPEAFAGATTEAELMAVIGRVPSNHSPKYAPVIDPTIDLGVRALVAAARTWLGPA